MCSGDCTESAVAMSLQIIELCALSYLYRSAQGKEPVNAAQAAQKLGNLVLQGPKLRGLWPQHHFGTKCLNPLTEVFLSSFKLTDGGDLAWAKQDMLAHATHLQ